MATQATDAVGLHNKTPQFNMQTIGAMGLPQMNTGVNYDHKDIVWRMKNGAHVTGAEKASLIAKFPQCFVMYAINNNLANVNDTLRHENGFNLPFTPDKKQIEAQADLLFAKGHEGALQDVMNKFVFNPSANNWTTDPELVSALKKLKVLK